VVVPGYEIEGELGHGGMGVVYKARQLRPPRPVALKLVRTGGQPTAQALDRFRREGEAVARLQHPNVVQIYEVGEHQGRPYLALEYVDGGSLAEKLAGAPQPYREAASLVEALGRAMHAAHQRGVVHRDLKPANVLLTADGTPKITDFGLAKRLDEEGAHTRTGVVMGTPSYMAPEQAAGRTKEVGPATDVYALGAILYEMLTGRPPFQAGSSEAVVRLVLSAEPAPPRRLRRHLPRDLQTICLTCLAKEPRHRYASALALAEDLRCYLDGRPIRRRPVGPVGRLWRWSRRNPLRALSGGLALALLAAAAGGFLSYRHYRHEQRRREAEAALDGALDLCTKGKTAEGMLWLARGLELAPADAADLHHVLRGNLAGWGRRLSHLKDVWPHPDQVWAVAISPDGRLAVTGCADGTARLWEVSTGATVRELLGHQRAVVAVAFSPDGARVLTGSHDGRARLWKVATGELIGWPLWHEKAVHAVAFSPDGKTVATGCEDRAARLWNADTGELIRGPLWHDTRVLAVAFSPDGKTVLTGSADKTARLWQVTSSKLPAKGLPHPEDAVYSVAFSPDGRTVLTAGMEVARLWDVATGKKWYDLSHQGGIRGAAFSPDGRALLTGGLDKTARLWEVGSGRPLGEPLQHPDGVQGVAFAPDGRSALTACADRTVRLWALPAMRSLGTLLLHENAAVAVAFSPDGKTVLTGCRDGRARFWGVATGAQVGEALEHASGPILAAAWGPDGRVVLTGGFDRTARLWDAITGKQLAALPHGGWVGAVAFSPDGKTVLTGSLDSTARLWDTASRRVLELRKHQPKKEVFAVAFSPDGRTALTGSEDGTARLWDTATGEPVGPPLVHDRAVFAVAFSPDGQTVLTGSGDHTARLWATATGEARGQPLRHEGRVFAVAFSPDGRTALTGSEDWTARLWDARTGKPLLGDGLRHDGAVRQVAFSPPDGRLVLTGSDDGTARLWDRVTGRPFGPPWRHPHKVSRVAFSPDGRTVAAGLNGVGPGTGAWLWDVPAPVEGAIDRVALWAEVITGLQFDGAGARALDAAAWRQRRQRLEELGGAPLP
jgi:WD40 repeat protein